MDITSMPKSREKSWVEQCGMRLQAAREALGFQQGTFAASIDVQQTTYARWEKGDRLVDPAAAVKIRARHGIALDFIYANDFGKLPYGLFGKVAERLPVQLAKWRQENEAV